MFSVLMRATVSTLMFSAAAQSIITEEDPCDLPPYNCGPPDGSGSLSGSGRHPGSGLEEIADDELETPILTWTNGFDDKGVYPDSSEYAGKVCKDHDLGGSCKKLWTGKTSYCGDSWNDVISSSYVVPHYRCQFFCDANFDLYMTTRQGQTTNWIRSWDNCISSWKCERMCNTTQGKCLKNDYAQMGACWTDKYLKCLKCKSGYVVNSNGACVVDQKCMTIDLVLTKVSMSSESTSAPNYMTLGTLFHDNCGNPSTLVSTTSQTQTTSQTVETSYELDESWEKTMGGEVGASVTMSVEGTIVPGFGVSASTTIDTKSSWSTTQSTASKKTTHETKQDTFTWALADSVSTLGYHNSTYTSNGAETPGTIVWEGTATCYNENGDQTSQKDVTGTYTGAKIRADNIKAVQTPCGAPAGFEINPDTECSKFELWDPATEYTAVYQFDNLIEAQAECQTLGNDCLGVFDPQCDGALTFYLCANNGNALAKSDGGSCVYTQKPMYSTIDRLSAATARFV